MINDNQILKVLSKVTDPVKKKDLISLKSIKKIKIFKNSVTIEILISPSSFKLKEIIRRNCINVLEKLNSTLEYNIKFSMNDDKKDIIENKSDNVNNKFKTKNIKNILAITSGKGGVGKSTISSNIAVGLRNQGAKVGLIDADIFGPSIPTMFNCENEQPSIKKENEKNIIIPIEQYGIKLLSIGLLIPKQNAVIWRGPMASSALKQMILDADWGELDYLIVDLPPGTSDIHITLSQNFNVKGSIIITSPQKISTIDAEKSIAMFNQKNTEVPIIGIIQNMSHFISDDNIKHFIFGENGGKDLAEKLNLNLLGDIPIDKNISESSDIGYPIVLKDKQISETFKKICEKIAIKIEENNFK
tara:strand:- start:513 stop:1589 length:1077 start_codon:yes stop_codon:yes gene_type:complete